MTQDAVISLKLRKIGRSVGILLPRQVLAALKASEGDTIFSTKTVDGFRITPSDPAFRRQMTVARKIMKSDRNILRELAKK